MTLTLIRPGIKLPDTITVSSVYFPDPEAAIPRIDIGSVRVHHDGHDWMTEMMGLPAPGKEPGSHTMSRINWYTSDVWVDLPANADDPYEHLVANTSPEIQAKWPGALEVIEAELAKRINGKAVSNRWADWRWDDDGSKSFTFAI